MGKFIDIAGNKFNRLTALKRVGISNSRKTIWLCKCECGNYTNVTEDNLKQGNVKSCGCLRGDFNRSRATHRKSNTRLYNTWRNMKARCKCPTNPYYKNYGGRGIQLYNDWAKFENFYNWSIENGYKDNLTIDRVNVNGNYEPNNCKWIPLSKQAYNKRDSLLFTINGEQKCLAEICKEYNVKYTTIYRRVTIGKMDIEDALAKSIKKRNEKEK